jgi:hypothetical protein
MRTGRAGSWLVYVTLCRMCLLQGLHAKGRTIYPYENVIISATSARGDLASLITTATRDSGWSQRATSSHEGRVPVRSSTLPIKVISAGGSRSGVFSVVPLIVPLSYGTKSAGESYAPGSAAGSTLQFLMSLRSIIRNRPRRSTTVQISPRMKGARKPKREYKAPPVGGPTTRLRMFWHVKNKNSFH